MNDKYGLISYMTSFPSCSVYYKIEHNFIYKKNDVLVVTKLLYKWREQLFFPTEYIFFLSTSNNSNHAVVKVDM